MKITRRKVLEGTAGVSAAVVAGGAFFGTAGVAHSAAAEDLIKEFTGGAAVGEGKVSLGAPEIAENGNTVPVEVSVESAMSADENVAAVLLVAAGNPNPNIATFMFTPGNGEAVASTRIRLAKTQDVVAVAKMSDGSFVQDRKTVKVTIGGCGG